MQKISVPSARPPVYTTAQRARQDGSVATSVPVTGSMNSNGTLLAHAGVDRVPAYRFVNERAHALHCIGRNFAPGATRCAVEIMSAHWMLGGLDAWQAASARPALASRRVPPLWTCSGSRRTTENWRVPRTRYRASGSERQHPGSLRHTPVKIMVFVSVPSQPVTSKKSRMSRLASERPMLRCSKGTRLESSGEPALLTRRAFLGAAAAAVFGLGSVVAPSASVAAPLTLNPFARKKEAKSSKGSKTQSSTEKGSDTQATPRRKKDALETLSPEDQEDIDELTKRLMSRKSSSEEASQ